MEGLDRKQVSVVMKATQGILVGTELFCILTVVLDIGTYTNDKTQRN